jgi:repressor LexA
MRESSDQLTERQQEIYEFIREKIDSRGYGPTVREIADRFKIKSPNGVMCHLKALEKKNYIQREGFSARAIQIVGYKPGSVTLPMLGVVSAGAPVSTIELDDKLELGELFKADNNYVLRVRGTSMIEDHIQDGDYVVIKKQETAKNGERVVAWVDGETTLKKFYKERNRVRLDPCNGAMKSIYVDPIKDIRVLGVLVGVLRKV